MSFNTDEIENLRNVYNKEHPTEEPIEKDQPTKVWSELKKRFHSHCNSGTPECIITSMMTKPVAPNSWVTNPEQWLSSDEIEELEKQYMKVFSNYSFVGAFPIDFDKRSKTGECLISSLCSMNIRSLYNQGKTQIGIIFNTDVSTGPGQHWIALFCDIRPELEFPRITYFDSYAEKPEKEIEVLMKRWKQQWDETKIHSKPMIMSYNKTRHQYQDSECGMYCLYFHYCCLLNISMDEQIPDDVVRGLRGLLFRVGTK
jgi:hypothetical protein